MKKLTPFQIKMARWLDGLPIIVFRLIQLSMLAALASGIFFARPFVEQGLNFKRTIISLLSFLYFVFSFKLYLCFVRWKQDKKIAALEKELGM